MTDAAVGHSIVYISVCLPGACLQTLQSPVSKQVLPMCQIGQPHVLSLSIPRPKSVSFILKFRVVIRCRTASWIKQVKVGRDDR